MKLQLFHKLYSVLNQTKITSIIIKKKKIFTRCDEPKRYIPDQIFLLSHTLSIPNFQGQTSMIKSSQKVAFQTSRGDANANCV